MARSGKRTGRASLALLAALTAAALWLGLGIRAAAAPEQPQSVAAQNCVTCIRVTWAATGGAEEYIVYRKVPGGPWAELGRTAGTVWNDRTAEDGTDYRYTVRARAGTAKSPLAAAAAVVRLAPPQVGAANARSGVRVSWSEVPAAERYAVYRRTPGGAWAKLKSVKAGTDSWLDGSAAGGTRYEYAVRAVCGGSRSALGQTALVRLGAPETASVKNCVTCVKAAWSAVPGAEKYALFRRGPGEAWVKVGTTAGTALCDRTAEGGRTWEYAVRAYGGDSHGALSATAGILRLETPAVTAEDTMAGVGLRWEAVAGAKDYVVLKKTGSGGWKQLAVTAGRQYTDTGEFGGEGAEYAVRARNGSCTGAVAAVSAAAAAGMPETVGFAPEPFVETVCGTSGLGRPLKAYRLGTGENVLLMTFAVHGFEDVFARDGRALVNTAFALMNAMTGWDLSGWTVWILPCCNPDGLIDGSTCDGPGRCTIRHLSGGRTVDGGVDINRCFPTAWQALSGDRNFNGTEPLACSEAAAIEAMMRGVKGTGRNVYLDVHGWTTQILTAEGRSDALFRAFSAQFPDNAWTRARNAAGYAVAHADALGYEACLFEFPFGVASMAEFMASTHKAKFLAGVKTVVS